MSEELNDYDEQLREILNEIRSSLDKDIPKLKGKAKIEKCEYAKNRLARAKQILKSYNVEIRELTRADAKPWEDKGREYDKTMEKLGEDITWAASSAERDELFNNKGRNADEMTAKALVDQGKIVQQESKASTTRTKDVLAQTLAVGSETAAALQSQTGQLGKIDDNLDTIESNLQRADKQIRVFMRRMATDKVIMLLIALVVVGIITAIAVQVTRKKLRGEEINGVTDVINTGRGVEDLI